MQIQLTPDELKRVAEVADEFARRDAWNRRECDDYFQLAATATLKLKRAGSPTKTSFIRRRTICELRSENGRRTKSRKRWAAVAPFSALESNGESEPFERRLTNNDGRARSIVDARIDVETVLSALEKLVGERNAAIVRAYYLENLTLKEAGRRRGVCESSASLAYF